MVERTHKPGPLSPVTSTHPTGDSGSVTVKHDHVKLSLTTGQSAEILLYGATIISWKSSASDEHLFVSEAAALDGSKAVRGGIPLVFPVFGPPPKDHATSALPQHGFARTSKWELLGKNDFVDGDCSVTVDFGLGPENLTVDARKAWPYDFGLIYSVTLGPRSLETKILVRNEGSEIWDFKALFHTYLRVGDVTNVGVEGLKGVGYLDKVAGGVEAQEEREAVEVKTETDRVYKKVPGAVTVSEGGKKVYTVERMELEDVVVWNPGEKAAQKMGDFRPESAWKNMLCIEAGRVSEWNTLEGQAVWEGGVVIRL